MRATQGPRSCTGMDDGSACVSALAGPVRNDERYRVLEDCTSFKHTRTWQQCQTSRRREGTGKVAIIRSPPAKGPPQGGLCAARMKRVVIGPSQGSANARRGTWAAPSCSLVSTNDRSERASAGSLPRPLGEIQRSESNLDGCLEIALLGRTERRVIRGFPALAPWISSRER